MPFTYQLTVAELPNVSGQLCFAVPSNFQNYCNGVFSGKGISVSSGNDVTASVTTTQYYGASMSFGSGLYHTNISKSKAVYIWQRTA